MKTTKTFLLAATLLSSLLSACGSPMLNGQPLASQMTAMTRMSQMSTPNRAQNVHANYMNLILKTGYSPDQNGMQFGFDFGSVSYINFEAKTIDLDLRYSARGKVLWVSLRPQNAPESEIENVDQKNTARLAEIASELRHLGAGTPQDKANIDRIASLLEHPPVHG